MRNASKHPGSARWALLVLGLSSIGACTPKMSLVPVRQAISQGQPGYQLALQAAACWFGGLWTEAEGVLPPQRRALTEQRCAEVTTEVFGDPGRVHRFRALEPPEVTALADRVARDGGDIGIQLRQFVSDLAAAQREALVARRAAERVRRDLRDAGESGKLAQQEIEAVGPLRAHEALDRLLTADLGPLTADAHALALLTALGRLNTVRGLRKHLKIYAMDSIGTSVFGAKLPEEAAATVADPGEPLKPGILLSYLVQLAQLGGYPVPELLKPREREMLAWHGIQKAFADRLRAEDQRLSQYAGVTLKPILDTDVRHLTQEYTDARKLLNL